MSDVICAEGTVCRSQCTNLCSHCKSNERSDAVENDYYEFNFWDDTESDYKAK